MEEILSLVVRPVGAAVKLLHFCGKQSAAIIYSHREKFITFVYCFQLNYPKYMVIC